MLVDIGTAIIFLEEIGRYKEAYAIREIMKENENLHKKVEHLEEEIMELRYEEEHNGIL